jgi:hypothetical protein
MKHSRLPPNQPTGNHFPIPKTTHMHTLWYNKRIFFKKNLTVTHIKKNKPSQSGGTITDIKTLVLGLVQSILFIY